MAGFDFFYSCKPDQMRLVRALLQRAQRIARNLDVEFRYRLEDLRRVTARTAAMVTHLEELPDVCQLQAEPLATFDELQTFHGDGSRIWSDCCEEAIETQRQIELVKAFAIREGPR